jgi:replicative DNA helicase
MASDIPFAIDIEKRVLGGLMFVGDHTSLEVQEAMLALNRESFYFPESKMVFDLIQKYYIAQNKFDFISLLDFVDPSCNLFFDTVHQEYYTDTYIATDIITLNKLRTLRRQIDIIETIPKLISQEKNFDVSLQIISENLKKITESNQANPVNVIKSCETLLEESYSRRGKNESAVVTDIHDLPPIPKRALITIAGRSGHGKTYFGMYLMDRIIDVSPGKHALCFNLEMHPDDMLERYSILLGVTGQDLYQILDSSSHLLLQRNFHMVSIPMITIEEIEIYSRVLANRNPLCVIIVDYLGLVTTKTKHPRKDLEQNEIAKRLAALSIELDCTVIAMIQVNREFKIRPVGQRCPIPSDSAEAMGSVHSASWWLGIDQPYLDNQDNEFKHVFQLHCRKNRHKTGLFKLEFDFRDGLFSPKSKNFSHSYSGYSPNVNKIPAID